MSAPVMETVLERQDFKGDATFAKTEVWVLLSECVEEKPLFI